MSAVPGNPEPRQSREALIRRARALDALRRRNERRDCEDSLIAFLARAWAEIEPDPFVLNWHHELVADELEGVAYGEERGLIINIPPRATKTLLVSVMFPAWLWAQPEERWSVLMGPKVRFLCVSYGATLSEEIAVKMRRLVTGPWYQEHWGSQVALREDQKNRSNFANHLGGERVSASIEGGLLGRGGIIQLIDDPHTTKGAESDIQRRETIEGMRALVTRVTNPRKAARILVMQRLHSDDATSFALENWPGAVRHIMLPQRYDPRRAIPEDPRAVEGELLWPRVWDEAAVTAAEHQLGPYMAAGQLQQAPQPRGGGVIQRAWWRLWPDDEPGAATLARPVYHCSMCQWLGYSPRSREDGNDTIECPACHSIAGREIAYPPFSFQLLSVDTNYGEKEADSWSAATAWGIWHDKNEAPRAMMTEAWRGRPQLRTWKDGAGNVQVGLVERIRALAERRRVDLILIEKKTRGVDLYNELARVAADWPFRLEWFDPTGRGDKLQRLHAVSGMFTADLVWAPDKQWAETVIAEVAAQPKAQFSDLSDTVSMSLLYLRAAGLLKTVVEHQRDELESNVFRSRRSSVAEAIEGV